MTEYQKTSGMVERDIMRGRGEGAEHARNREGRRAKHRASRWAPPPPMVLTTKVLARRLFQPSPPLAAFGTEPKDLVLVFWHRLDGVPLNELLFLAFDRRLAASGQSARMAC